jgi:hypothetical protein
MIPPPSSSSLEERPPLWLVDATGAYPVRAMCVGGGMDKASGEPVAKLVQGILRRRDFADLSAEEGLKALLSLLSNEDEALRVGPLLKRGTRLEMAVVDNTLRKMIRKPCLALQLVD